MSKVKTLEDFLKNYIETKSAENAEMSYSEYRRNEGEEHIGDYHRAIERAMNREKTLLPTYGAVAESLGGVGLSASGYSRHLLDRAQGAYADEISDAEARYEEGEARLRSGYASYLADHRSRATRLREKVSTLLVNNDVADYDTAYSYAISQGLSASDAAAVGATVRSAVRYKLYRQVMDRIISFKLEPEAASAYALSIGLSAEDSKELAGHAEKLMSTEYGTSEEYLKYLESIGAIITGHGVHTSGDHSN